MDRVDRATVYFAGIPCGVLRRTNGGYEFRYARSYLERQDAVPLSRSLPLSYAPHRSVELFPYFAGLAAEGWLQRQQSAIQKIDPADLLTLLVHNGEDLAGASSLAPFEGRDRT